MFVVVREIRIHQATDHEGGINSKIVFDFVQSIDPVGDVFVIEAKAYGVGHSAHVQKLLEIRKLARFQLRRQVLIADRFDIRYSSARDVLSSTQGIPT